MKVLVVSRSYPSDVLSTLGLWVARPTELLSAHCDVRILSVTPWCPPLPDIGPLRQYVRFRRIPREESRGGVRVLRPRYLAGPGSLLQAFESAAQRRAVARTVDALRDEFPFDLVHAHMVYPEGAVGHALASRFGVPLVISEHAPWTAERFRRRRIRRESLAAAKAAASLLAVSTSVRDSITAFGVDRERIRVVPIGVDPDRFTLGPEEARRPDQILFVGWINFMKGIDVLLDAMDLLRRRGRPARLVLAGGALYRNTRLQEERLRAKAASLELGDRVTFLGRVPHAEVARMMGESAVVVLPSRAESFGAVLVEALACGTPVVATRCGGPDDVVVPGVGRLVPVGDASALAEALAAVLDDRTLRDRERLRRYAIERFSWDRVVGETLDAYRAAIGTKLSAPSLASGSRTRARTRIDQAVTLRGERE